MKMLYRSAASVLQSNKALKELTVLRIFVEMHEEWIKNMCVISLKQMVFSS